MKIDILKSPHLIERNNIFKNALVIVSEKISYLKFKEHLSKQHVDSFKQML